MRLHPAIRPVLTATLTGLTCVRSAVESKGVGKPKSARPARFNFAEKILGPIFSQGIFVLFTLLALLTQIEPATDNDRHRRNKMLRRQAGTR